jgi:phosphate transport system ATP-binding protein
MTDFIAAPDAGTIRIDGQDIHALRDAPALRAGSIFSLPSGYRIVYDRCLRAAQPGLRDSAGSRESSCLTQAALWDGVRIDPATRDQAGRQQRRRSRALSFRSGLCLDEFSIAVDPVTSMKIEEVIKSLKTRMTVILVATCAAGQGRRSYRPLLDGRLIEVDRTG